jgi:hypothetical protein
MEHIALGSRDLCFGNRDLELPVIDSKSLENFAGKDSAIMKMRG